MQKGARFKLDGSNLRGYQRVAQELRRRSEAQAEVWQAVLDACAARHDGVADMPSVCEAANRVRSTIVKLVQQLESQGLVRSQYVRPSKQTRSVREYTLIADTNALAASPSDPQRALIEQEDPQRAAELFYDRDFHRNRLPWKGERFVVFNLLSALRLGRVGKHTRSREARVYMGRAYFDVRLESSEGMIPSVIDLRPLIVLLTLIREHIQHHSDGKTATRYRINLRDIAQAMDLTPSAGNLRGLFSQLERWRYTNIKLKAVFNGALDWAKDLFSIEDSVVIISRLKVFRYRAREGVTPESITVELTPAVRESLSEITNALSVHQEILHERNPHPFSHLVYYWCRRAVQHDHGGRTFTLRHLHRELAQQQAEWGFRTSWLKLMKRHWDAAAGAARLPGYVIEYDDTAQLATIRADSADPIVGRGRLTSHRG